MKGGADLSLSMLSQHYLHWLSQPTPAQAWKGKPDVTYYLRTSTMAVSACHRWGWIHGATSEAMSLLINQIVSGCCQALRFSHLCWSVDQICRALSPGHGLRANPIPRRCFGCVHLISEAMSVWCLGTAPGLHFLQEHCQAHQSKGLHQLHRCEHPPLILSQCISSSFRPSNHLTSCLWNPHVGSDLSPNTLKWAVLSDKHWLWVRSKELLLRVPGTRDPTKVCEGLSIWKNLSFI